VLLCCVDPILGNHRLRGSLNNHGARTHDLGITFITVAGGLEGIAKCICLLIFGYLDRSATFTFSIKILFNYSSTVESRFLLTDNSL